MCRQGNTRTKTMIEINAVNKVIKNSMYVAEPRDCTLIRPGMLFGQRVIRASEETACVIV